MPGQLDPPTVTDIDARSADLYWTPPSPANGIITSYHLSANGTETLAVSGNVTHATVSGLSPFTVYQFAVDACTVIGCVESSESAPTVTKQDGNHSTSALIYSLSQFSAHL